MSDEQVKWDGHTWWMLFLTVVWLVAVICGFWVPGVRNAGSWYMAAFNYVAWVFCVTFFCGLFAAVSSF